MQKATGCKVVGSGANRRCQCPGKGGRRVFARKSRCK